MCGRAIGLGEVCSFAEKEEKEVGVPNPFFRRDSVVVSIAFFRIDEFCFRIRNIFDVGWRPPCMG